MQLGEFGLIEVLRKALGEADPDLLIGMGDDAAVVRCPEALAVCSDTMVAGRHFFADVAASD
ncbi:MAG: thiamine-phosphate kinase, partial [Acidithiobacillus sp.]